MPSQVTGLVLTYNGQQYLKKCLESLSFCDQILVVDSESTDQTRAIARQCGARVIVNPWPGPARQLEFAFKHINTPWVVSLDQDEILSPRLQQEITSALQNPSDYTGFYCPRTSFYFDRFIRHSGWYPDFLLRVFLLEKTYIHTSGPHYGFRTRGKTRKLSGDIIHYPYQNLKEHLDKINYYTQEAAEEMFARGKTTSLFNALGHGLGRFLKLYILKKGFLDGRAGFILAINSFFYAFHKYIRLLELHTNKDKTQNKKF